MAKFYVQSGTLKMVLDAKDCSGAILWAVHSRLSPISSVYEGNDFDEAQQIDQVMLQAMIELEPTVQVSEIGFDRNDAQSVDTFDVALQWHELAKTINRLEDKLQ